MKSSTLFVLILLVILPAVLNAQWTYLGLWDKPVHEFKIENDWLFAGTDSGLYKKQLNSSDTTWSLMGFEGTRIYDFIVFSLDTILICKKTNPSVQDTLSLFITYNGGITWYSFQNGFGIDSNSRRCFELAKGSPGSNEIFARSSYCVAKSQNNGLSWQLVHGLWESTGNPGGKNIFHFYSNGTCWAAGLSGYLQPYLIRSFDFGNSWEHIDMSSYGDYAAISLLQNKTNGNEVLLGQGNSLLKSYDSGESWEYLFNDYPLEYTFDLKYSTNEDSLIYAASYKVLTQSSISIVLFGSNNFGESWEPIDSLELPPQQYFGHLELVKENQAENIYLATNPGVFKYSFPVGINESNADKQGYSGTIYPNPFHSNATIKLFNSENELKTLMVYNLYGELLKTEIQFTTDQIIIDRNGLNNGIYLFSISSESGKCFSGTFIVE